MGSHCSSRLGLGEERVVQGGARCEQREDTKTSKRVHTKAPAPAGTSSVAWEEPIPTHERGRLLPPSLPYQAHSWEGRALRGGAHFPGTRVSSGEVLLWLTTVPQLDFVSFLKSEEATARSCAQEPGLLKEVPTLQTGTLEPAISPAAWPAPTS